jgi:hypothetical protein
MVFLRRQHNHGWFATTGHFLRGPRQSSINNSAETVLGILERPHGDILSEAMYNKI